MKPVCVWLYSLKTIVCVCVCLCVCVSVSYMYVYILVLPWSLRAALIWSIAILYASGLAKIKAMAQNVI